MTDENKQLLNVQLLGHDADDDGSEHSLTSRQRLG